MAAIALGDVRHRQVGDDPVCGADRLRPHRRRCGAVGEHLRVGYLHSLGLPGGARGVEDDRRIGAVEAGWKRALRTIYAAKGVNLRLDTDIGSILGYILVGLIVGLLARMLVPGRDPVGLLGTLAIGVVGAVLGGWLAGAFFKETAGVDWLASIGVAVLLVLLVRSGSRRRGLEMAG